MGYVMEYQRVTHPFEPVYSKTSKILILGSLPSVKSRENNFYYGHKQNRFWKVLGSLFGETISDSIVQKKDFLLRHDIAVWDVIQSCDIKGSSDSSIKNVVPADIGRILKDSQITRIYCNGRTAGMLYDKYQAKKVGLSAEVLPSTSPTNAAYSLERLIQEWKRTKQLFN